VAEKLLIVDDDLVLGDLLSEILEETGAKVFHVTNGTSALTAVEQETYSLILLDLLLPGMDGLEVLKRLKNLSYQPITIIMSGHGTIAKAVEATKLGAYDFLEKPLERERVLLTVRNALEKSKLRRAKTILIEEAKSRYQMIAVSDSMQQIFGMMDRVAASDITALITGESGTGKELIARAIHLNSARASERFVQVNCAAIPEELVESELFGHVKGSFTGAITDQIGKFQQANGGTLFLDEVGDLSLRAQAKVLRAIENGEIAKVGCQKYDMVDVRLIAATNHNLSEMVAQKTFRADLFHRLNVIPIAVPPLRERADDILPLIDHFMTEFCHKNHVPTKKFLPDAEGMLLAYSWPGNIRELKNFVDKLLLLIDSSEISGHLVSHLLNLSSLPEDLTDQGKLRKAKDSFERSYILSVLESNNWNITQTARLLGVNRSHLYRILDKFNILPPSSVAE